MSDSLTNALEAAVDKLEAAVTVREHDSVRLVTLEAAANDAIAAIDTLLGDAPAEDANGAKTGTGIGETS
jgi:hypothetical protein